MTNPGLIHQSEHMCHLAGGLSDGAGGTCGGQVCGTPLTCSPGRWGPETALHTESYKGDICLPAKRCRRT